MGAGSPPAPPSAPLAADLAGITKSFFGVTANDSVDFDLRWGEVHALLGENGAGKSTLCSVMAGLYRPDAGSIHVDGDHVHFRSPHDALSAGIGMVFQHFRLVPNLTVAENLALGHPGTPLRVSRRHVERATSDLVDRYGLHVDPRARVWQLSVGEQQRVEILKLLFRDVRILILDEPTAVLTPQEADTLFATTRQMARDGRAVVIVSHKLHEIMQATDRITVLRNGRRVGQVATADAHPTDLAEMMVGRRFELPTRSAERIPGETQLRLEGLVVEGDRGLDAVRGIDLDVRAGEIVGIAGVSGNGQRELAEAVSGLRPLKAGSIHIGGRDVTTATTKQRIDAGLSFVPESRLGTGLAPGLDIEANLALKGYREPPIARGLRVSRVHLHSAAQRLIAQHDIRGVRPGLPVRLLSGGNLQKAIIARETSRDPKILMAASPTRGLDVGATAAVRSLLLEQRAEGVAVLLLSEDLDELLALADRIPVIYGGRIVGELSAGEADERRLGLLMAGHAA